jgi:hypothetical protein
MDLYKTPGLVADVKRRMLELLGHVIGIYRVRLAMDGWLKRSGNASVKIAGRCRE